MGEGRHFESPYPNLQNEQIYLSVYGSKVIRADELTFKACGEHRLNDPRICHEIAHLAEEAELHVRHLFDELGLKCQQTLRRECVVLSFQDIEGKSAYDPVRS